MFRKTTSYLGQDYDRLKKKCLSGQLFIDPLFQPSSKSLTYKGDSGVVWKRPGEISPDPKLFVDVVDANDFKQGILGNCWFVAACACIAETPNLWKRLVPDYEKQENFGTNTYAGIFHFQFFREGGWIDVVIDDLLPTRYGKLIYTSSHNDNEFWSALLEKAYAKLFGDYESLESGRGKDALVDMLGGVGQTISFKSELKTSTEKQNELFEELLDAHENFSLMTASIEASSEEKEKKLSNGLIMGHAYSVTSVRRIRQGIGLRAFFKNQKLDMIRLRNPWGRHEWNGAWSDRSPEWNNVRKKDREAADLCVSDDGEFWMSFADFVANFSSIDICHMINTNWFSLKKYWSQSQLEGQWIKPHRAGGCSNHESFLLNPQYIFDVKNEIEDVIVSLEQEDQRKFREYGKENKSIGIAIHKADLNRKYRMSDKLERSVATEYVNSRSVFLRHKFPKGRYLIVPSTFDPGHEAKFWLRVYSGTKLDFTELIDEGPKSGGCFGSKYKIATHIDILKAAGLQSMGKRGVNPYCKVRCEKYKFEIPQCKNTINPEWNWRFTMYRKNFASDIIVEVWNSNLIKDDFMGQCVIEGIKGKTQDATINIGVKVFPLKGKKKEEKQGNIFVKIQNFNDMYLA